MSTKMILIGAAAIGGYFWWKKREEDKKKEAVEAVDAMIKDMAAKADQSVTGEGAAPPSWTNLNGLSRISIRGNGAGFPDY